MSSSTSSLPVTITELIQSPRIDWRRLHNLVEQQGDEFDWELLESSLCERMRTSSNPVGDADDVFSYRRDYDGNNSLLDKLRGHVYKELSLESKIELLQRINLSSHHDSMLSYRLILNVSIAEDTLEHFKRVVLEILRFFYSEEPRFHFFALAVLELSETMEEYAEILFPEDMEILEGRFRCLLDRLAEALTERDDDGNTCLNYMVGRGQAPNYTALHFTKIYDACEGAIRIPNHQGTLPMHNMFTVHLERDGLEGKQLFHLFRKMLDSFPDAVLYQSREFHGRTPLHMSPPSCIFLNPESTRQITDEFLDSIKSAVQTYPNVLQIVDDYGLTPLNNIMACRESILLDKAHCYARWEEILLSPKAARIASNDGMLPLHNALRTGGRMVDALCAAAPETVERRDPETFLYPFLMECNDVNTSYKLLRMAPQLVDTSSDDESSLHQQREAT